MARDSHERILNKKGLATIVLFLAIVAIAVWQNYLSYQIVSAAGAAILAIFSVICLSTERPVPYRKIALSVIGALFALALVFIFFPPQPVVKKFPVVFFSKQPDNLPVSIPIRQFLMENAFPIFGAARQANPSAFNLPNGVDAINFDEELYEEFLQRLLIDWIASRHSGTWRADISRVNAGSASMETWSSLSDASEYESTILTTAELEQKFRGNRFARVRSFGSGALALPKGMTLIIEKSQRKTPGSKIHFKDAFCELTIKITFSGGSVGLGGYAILVDMPLGFSQQHYWSEIFTVQLNASFNRWLMGHPKMTAHRAWAEQIIEGLENAFNEELIWRQTIENIMLYKHSPTKYPLGPVGTYPPPSQ
jgi:hypothetical protein